MSESIVMRQDEETELHVQAMMQSGRRLVDIRLWRHGPSGFNPSRSGLTLDLADLDCLQAAIAQLLNESNGGTRVARIVRDDIEGRRLRAEIEPFGARYVARFAFWQRVRSTWRAADDGLTIGVVMLEPLQASLSAYRPWLVPPEGEAAQQPIGKEREITLGWPAIGGDWLTVEPDRVALHPRGARITFTVDEAEPQRIIARQWRRNESLWVPERSHVALSAPDIDALLARLRTMIEAPESALRLTLESGVELRLDGNGAQLRIEERQPAEDDFEPRLELAVDQVPRLGRALAQCWYLLVDRLPEGERLDMGLTLSAPPPPDIVLSFSRPASEEPAVIMTEPDEGIQEVQQTPEPAAEPEPEPQPEPPLSVQLGSFQVGGQYVGLLLRGTAAAPLFTFRWEDHVLSVPLDSAQDLLSGLRALYYNALLGRRGQALHIGDGPMLVAAIHNKGMQLQIELEQQREGEIVALTFPAPELPILLNATEAALARMERE